MDINGNIDMHVFTGGIDSDSSDMVVPQNTYRDATNIRISTRGVNASNYEVLVVHKDAPLIQDCTEGLLGNNGGKVVILDSKSINNYVVWVLAQENSSATGKADMFSIVAMNINDMTPYTVLHSSDWSNIDIKDIHIDSVLNYEDSDTIMYYFVDGIHDLCSVNIYNVSEYTGIDQISAVKPVMVYPPKFAGYASGVLSAGEYQYAIQLYKKHGAMSKISPATRPIPVVYSDKGFEVGTTTSVGIKIEIPQVFSQGDVQLFDRIKVFRIFYQNAGESPTISVISDTPYYNVATDFIDAGQDGIENYTIEQYNLVSGVHIIPKTIDAKNNYLFAANIIEKGSYDSEHDLGDRDFKAYSYTLGDDTQKYGSYASGNVSKNPIFDSWDLPNNTSKAWFTEPDGNNQQYYGGSGAIVSWKFVRTDIVQDNHTLAEGPDPFTDTSEYGNYKFGVTTVGIGHGAQSGNISDTLKNSQHYIKSDGSIEQNNDLNLSGVTGGADNKKVGWENPFTNYAIKSLQRGEIYRYGIILYDKYGYASDVQFVADIRVPDMYTKGFETFNTHPAPTQSVSPEETPDLTVHPIGVEFEVDETLLPDWVVGYEFVRCSRSFSDRHTLFQGVLSRSVERTESPLKTAAKHTYNFCPSGWLTTSYFWTGNNTFNRIAYQENSLNYTSIQSVLSLKAIEYSRNREYDNFDNSSFYQFVCPEVCYTEDSVKSVVSSGSFNITTLAYLWGANAKNSNNGDDLNAKYRGYMTSMQIINRVYPNGSLFDNDYKKTSNYNPFSFNWFTYVQPGPGNTWFTLTKYRDLDKITDSARYDRTIDQLNGWAYNFKNYNETESQFKPNCDDVNPAVITIPTLAYYSEYIPNMMNNWRPTLPLSIRWQTYLPNNSVGNEYDLLDGYSAPSTNDNPTQAAILKDRPLWTLFSYIKLYLSNNKVLLNGGYEGYHNNGFGHLFESKDDAFGKSAKIQYIDVANNYNYDDFYDTSVTNLGGQTDKNTTTYTSKHQSSGQVVGKYQFNNWCYDNEGTMKAFDTDNPQVSYLYNCVSYNSQQGLKNPIAPGDGNENPGVFPWGPGGKSIVFHINEDDADSMNTSLMISHTCGASSGSNTSLYTNTGSYTHGNWDMSSIGINDAFALPSIMGTYLCNMTHQVPLPYGGFDKSAIDNSQYWSYGDFYVKGNDTGKKSTVYDGDVFIHPLEYTSRYKYTVNWWKFPLTTSIIYSIPCETTLNLAYSYGYEFSRNTGNSNASLIQRDPVVAQGLVQDKSQYLYNTTYNQAGLLNNYSPYDDDRTHADSTVPNRVYYSDLKHKGANSDEWLKFSANNYIDVDATFGGITCVRKFGNEMLFWQDHAFGKLSVNERQVIESNTSSATLALGTGGVLDRYDYVYTKYGMLEGDFTETQTDTSVFWFDRTYEAICRYSAGNNAVDNISVATNASRWTESLADYDGSEDVVRNKAFYDPYQLEVVFQIGKDVSTVYSAGTAKFTSKYTIPREAELININNGTILRVDGDTGKYHISGYQLSDDTDWRNMMLSYTCTAGNEKYSSNKVFDLMELYGTFTTSTNTDAILSNKFKFDFNTYARTGDTVAHQTSSCTSSNFTARERNYRMAIPRSTLDYGGRMRGKSMRVTMQANENDHSAENINIALQYITIKFRQSLV